jgi:hypothetical protein
VTARPSLAISIGVQGSHVLRVGFSRPLAFQLLALSLPCPSLPCLFPVLSCSWQPAVARPGTFPRAAAVPDSLVSWVAAEKAGYVTVHSGPPLSLAGNGTGQSDLHSDLIRSTCRLGSMARQRHGQRPNVALSATEPSRVSRKRRVVEQRRPLSSCTGTVAPARSAASQEW